MSFYSYSQVALEKELMSTRFEIVSTDMHEG